MTREDYHNTYKVPRHQSYDRFITLHINLKKILKTHGVAEEKRKEKRINLFIFYFDLRVFVLYTRIL